MPLTAGYAPKLRGPRATSAGGDGLLPVLVAAQHVGAVRAEHRLEQGARETAPGLDEGDLAAPDHVQALEDPLPEEPHLAGEPVVAVVGLEEGVVGEHPGEIAPRAEQPRPDLELVVAQVARLHRRARGRGRAARSPLPPARFRPHRPGGSRSGPRRTRSAVRAARSIATLEVAIPPRVRPGLALEVRPRDPARGGAARGEAPGAFADRLVEARARGELVDEAPVERAPAPYPLLHRAEEVGVVAPNLPLVDDPGETTRPGQDAEEGDLGEGHRARAVVDQQDPVAGEGELVAPARRRAIKRRDVPLPPNGRTRPRSRSGSRW